MSYFYKKKEIQAEVEKLADILSTTKNTDRKALINQFKQKWNHSLKSTYSIEMALKEESRGKENLTAEDIQSANGVLQIKDEFGFIDFNIKRPLTEFDFMENYQENSFEKTLRLITHRNQKLSLSGNNSSFFRRHPYLTTAALALSAALAVTSFTRMTQP